MNAINETKFALTDAQDGIWIGQALASDASMYNIATCIELRGSLDVCALREALRETLAESAALQLCVRKGSSPLLQELHPRWNAFLQQPLEMVSVFGADEAERRTAANEWMRQDVRTPLDLNASQLHRFVILEIAPGISWFYVRSHHFVLDGYGLQIVLRKLAQRYTNRVRGWEAPKSGRHSLSDVLHDERTFRESRDFPRSRDFWLNYLADRPAAVRLQSSVEAPDHPLVARGSLDEDFRELCKCVALRASVTWADVAVALVADFVAEQTQVNEVILGIPMSGRFGRVAATVPCMVMNIISLRVRIDRRASIDVHARSVAHEMWKLRPHARYRYEHLRRDLRRFCTEQPLFGPVVNILPFQPPLVFDKLDVQTRRLASGPVEDASFTYLSDAAGHSSQFELELHPSVGNVDAVVVWREHFIARARDRLRAAQTERATLFPSSPKTSDVRTGRLPKNDVLEKIWAHAQATPQAAVLAGDETFDYGQLQRDVFRLAAKLGDRRCETESRVAIALTRGYFAIVAMLAVMQCGATFVPLDPQGPSQRLRFICSESSPKCVITSSQFSHLFDSNKCSILTVDGQNEDDDIAARSSVIDREANLDPTAYVIYTSGSTGDPNGVMVSRSALTHFCDAAQKRYEFRACDRVLQFAPLHFDACIEEIFVALCVGATLVIREGEHAPTVSEFLHRIDRDKVTVLDLPTAFWHECVYAMALRSRALPSSVRLVIVGGEAVRRDRLAQWFDLLDRSVKLLNTYGPTECTVVATAAELRPDDLNRWEHESISIGYPLSGVEVAVVDPEGNAVRSGEVGELLVMGPTLARGYLHRPRLNSSRFISNGDRRAYRSGDLVHQSSDGELFYRGRVDDEVKISGFRVHPLEVEAALVESPQIQEACVLVERDAEQKFELIAFVSPLLDQPAIDESELRRHLSERLIRAAIPRRFVYMDALPKSRSGKIDRQALRTRAPQQEARSSSTDALSPMQALIAGIWSDVLGARVESADADFFALGGESLQVVQVATRLSAMMDRDVEAATLLRYSRLSQLAQALDDQNGADTSAGISPGVESKMQRDASYLPPLSAPWMGEFGSGAVLLSGATGYLGIHVLRSLLLSSERNVYCFVRASDDGKARDRLSQVWKERFSELPTQNEFSSVRLHVIAADLEKPDFGLERKAYLELAGMCDAVLHCGAAVSLGRSYDSVRECNVVAVQRLVEFATIARAKRLVYTSSLAVAPSCQKSDRIPETFLPLHDELSNGYVQSKWVAERVIENASEAGLDAFVVRLGRLCPHERSGSSNENDFLARVARASLRAGAYPNIEAFEVWTRVSEAADMLSDLAGPRAPSGRVLNVAGDSLATWQDLFESLGAADPRLKRVSLREWVKKITSSSDSDDNLLAAIWGRPDDLGGTKSGLGLAPVDRASYLDFQRFRLQTAAERQVITADELVQAWIRDGVLSYRSGSAPDSLR